MIVAGSSILVRYISREPGWERVQQVILEKVVTVVLTVREVANALWKEVLCSEMSSGTALEIVSS